MTTAETAAGVLWLASYPKTGSTWLREILTNIVAPQTGRATAIPSFQKAWPETVPNHRLWDQPVQIVKTHLHPEHSRMELCPLPVLGAITIRRHPLDVLLSALNYAKVKEMDRAFRNNSIKSVEQIVADGEFEHYIDVFRDTDGFPWFSGPSAELSLYMGRWRRFASDLRYHEICYEDLFANPEGEIRRLLTFLQVTTSDAHIKQIHAAADRRTAQNGAFFWKRRAYNFEQLLPPEMIASFYDKCGDHLRAQGYPETYEAQDQGSQI